MESGREGETAVLHPPNRWGPARLRWADGGLAWAEQGSHGSACIITAEPNELLAGIHNRMHVILPKDAWGLQLDLATRATGVLSRWTLGFTTSWPLTRSTDLLVKDFVILLRLAKLT